MSLESSPHTPELIACPDCDSLFVLRSLSDADRVVCSSCSAILYEHKRNALSRATAFALSALVLLFVAHFFPFLSLEVGGRMNEIVLINSAGALYDFGSPWLALTVAVFVVGAPAMLVLGILYVQLPLARGRALPGAIVACRWVYDAGPWNMIEIFMLGILVSMLKLTKIATVHLGIAFWALALLIICVTASLGAIDRSDLWGRLEVAKRRP